jgi:hypothetical protein
MLSVEQMKKILDDPNLSDDQITEIRDSFRILAEIIFDEWAKDRAKTAKKESNI